MEGGGKAWLANPYFLFLLFYLVKQVKISAFSFVALFLLSVIYSNSDTEAIENLPLISWLTFYGYIFQIASCLFLLIGNIFSLISPEKKHRYKCFSFVKVFQLFKK
jgi:hypothetical protein